MVTTSPHSDQISYWSSSRSVIDIHLGSSTVFTYLPISIYQWDKEINCTFKDSSLSHTHI